MIFAVRYFSSSFSYIAFTFSKVNLSVKSSEYVGSDLVPNCLVRL